MATSTLRNWGGAVAVSLPKKVLSLIGLKAGATVEVKIEAGSIVLAPVRQKPSLEQLEKEQRALERKLGRLADPQWLDAPPTGRESW